jgi:hypothetical protein
VVQRTGVYAVGYLPAVFRTTSARESSSGGTGLGLAIASEAVRLHDGTQNRGSGGLQVTITLSLGPRSPAREEDLQHSINEACAVQAGRAARGRREPRDE